MKANSKGTSWISLQEHSWAGGAGGHRTVVTILFLAAAGLLLVGLISDSYFSAIILGTLLGGAIVGLWPNNFAQFSELHGALAFVPALS